MHVRRHLGPVVLAAVACLASGAARRRPVGEPADGRGSANSRRQDQHDGPRAHVERQARSVRYLAGAGGAARSRRAVRNRESPNSKYFRDILSDFKPDERPLTAEGAELLRKNGQPGVFNPSLNCLPDGLPKGDLLPEPFKIIHSAGVIVVLYEVETTFRQIFTDGRKLPVDPSPSWQGTVGRWEGDTLVVDTAGFNDRGWLDARGTGHSTEMRIEERFRRRDYGHLDLTITITDPMTFTRPITISVVEELLPDTDLFEHYCLENEKDDAHFPGRARK